MSEYIYVTVIPCGREDGKNSDDEKPYEHKIRKKRKFNPQPYKFCYNSYSCSKRKQSQRNLLEETQSVGKDF